MEPNSALQRDFIDMDLRWLQLARSYQFLDQLCTFSAERGKQRGELSLRLEQLKRSSHKPLGSSRSKRDECI